MQQLQQQAQSMQQELERRDQVETAKDMSVANLNTAKADQIRASVPLDQAKGAAELEQTKVETSGKRVEQAANIQVATTGREQYLRGIE